MIRLEVIATTLADAVAAQHGGADSVEICIDLANDGLTPPLELVKAIRDAIQLDINVMLRPHSRDFCYDGREIALMLEQIAAFKPLGVQSLVFGAHNGAGEIDIALMKTIAEAANPLKLTLHRALDRSVQPETALEGLIGVVDRVLTSGPAPNAYEGREGLRRWVSAYGEHYRFVAGGGIRHGNVREIALTTGVHECHVGSAAQTQNRVDPGKVRQLVELLLL